MLAAIVYVVALLLLVGYTLRLRAEVVDMRQQLTRRDRALTMLAKSTGLLADRVERVTSQPRCVCDLKHEVRLP